MEQQLLCADDCLENVIQAYSDMVYRQAFSYTRNKYDSDDIYQEVFLRYIRKKPMFESEEHRHEKNAPELLYRACRRSRIIIRFNNGNGIGNRFPGIVAKR